jgi:hypothetical protein
MQKQFPEKLIISLAIMVLLSSILKAHAINADGYELDAEENNQIQKLCMNFYGALKKKDINKLVSLAQPSVHNTITNMLNDEGSELHETLLSSELNKNECWRKFINLDELVCQVERIAPGPGVELYLGDGSVQGDDTCNGLSVYMFRIDGRWHISYQYFFDEPY